MTDSTSVIAETFLSVAKTLSPKLRRLYKERKAARMPIGGTHDFLEKGMDETLDRLTGGKAIDEWWERLLNKIGHEYISPKFLRIHAINDWLSGPQVQTDFKSLSENTLWEKKTMTKILTKDSGRHILLKLVRMNAWPMGLLML